MAGVTAASSSDSPYGGKGGADTSESIDSFLLGFSSASPLVYQPETAASNLSELFGPEPTLEVEPGTEGTPSGVSSDGQAGPEGGNSREDNGLEAQSSAREDDGGLSDVPETAALTAASAAQDAYSVAEEQVATLLAAMPPPIYGPEVENADTHSEPASSGATDAEQSFQAASPEGSPLVSLTGIPQWLEQGPNAILNGQVVIPAQNNPVAGGVQSIAVHPDGRHAFLGTVNGGVWRTRDIRALVAGQPSPVWEPMTDQFSTLSIGSIAIDPSTTATTPLSQTILYAGTGSFTNSGSIDGFAKGVLRSSNGGTSWKLLGADTFFDLRITKVVPTAFVSVGGSVVYVAALDKVDPNTQAVTKRGGVFRGVTSEDAAGHVTEAWTRVSGGANTGLPDGSATDLIADPADVFTFYAAIPKQGIYKRSAADNWSLISGGANGVAQAANADRILLSIHSSAGNHVIYAGLIGDETTITTAIAVGDTTIQVANVGGFQVGEILTVNSRPVRTTLTADVAAGSMQLSVADASVFANVTRLLVGGGAAAEFHSIASFDPAANTVTLATALANSHVQESNVSSATRSVNLLAINAVTSTLTVDAITGVAGNQPFPVPFPAGISLARNPSAGRLSGLFRTGDGGTNWTALTLPTSIDIVASLDLNNDGDTNDAGERTQDNNGDGDTRDAGERVAVTSGIHPGGQGEINFSLLADPNNPNIFFVSGDRQTSVDMIPDRDANGNGRFDFPAEFIPGNAAGLTDFVARIFQGNATTNVWQQRVGNGASNTAPHADSRVMAVLPPLPGSGGTYSLLEADDAGIYVLINPTAANAQWQSLNGNLRITEAYSVGYDSTNNVSTVGNQDTGTAYQSAQNNLIWNTPLFGTFATGPGYQTGDGNTQAVDATSNANLPFRYSMGNSFSFFWLRQYSNLNVLQDLVAGEAAGTNYFARLIRLGMPGSVGQPQIGTGDATHLGGLTQVDRRIPFVPKLPYAVNRFDPTRLVLGFSGLYESFNPVTGAGDQGDTVQQVQGDMFPFVRAVAYGGRFPDATGTLVNNNDLLVFTRGSSLYIRSAAPTAYPPVAAAEIPARRIIPGAKDIRDIMLDPDDGRIIYAVDEQNVWRTTDRGFELAAADRQFARRECELPIPRAGEERRKICPARRWRRWCLSSAGTSASEPRHHQLDRVRSRPAQHSRDGPGL